MATDGWWASSRWKTSASCFWCAVQSRNRAASRNADTPVRENPFVELRPREIRNGLDPITQKLRGRPDVIAVQPDGDNLRIHAEAGSRSFRELVPQRAA